MILLDKIQAALQPLRQLMIALAQRGDDHAQIKSLRRFRILQRNLLRQFTDPSRVAEGYETIERLDAVMRAHKTEADLLKSAAEIAAGDSGPFDCCDLGAWLGLAKAAGVAAVPAQLIASLSDAEISFLSGKIPNIQDKTAARLEQLADKAKATLEALQTPVRRADSDTQGEAETQFDSPLLDLLRHTEEFDVETLLERLTAPLDDLPENIMVRSHRCASSSLKAIVGAGGGGPGLPVTAFNEQLSVGPGWIRRGNRRMIDAINQRLLEAAAHGPQTGLAFYARPWISGPADRYSFCDDPHRHGTAFEGPGLFPAEWRVYVEAGQVVGASAYYPWATSKTPRNARVALAACALAQKIVDQAILQQAWPRQLDIELVRQSGHPDLMKPEVQDLFARLPRDGVSCSIDFIEAADAGTPENLLFLEAGPPHAPFANCGHSCGFTGRHRDGQKGFFDVRGIAYRLMPHVSLIDQKTWRPIENPDSSVFHSFEEALAYSQT